MSNPDYQLIHRLERAEHLIRADLMSARLEALKQELIADQLDKQAEILCLARIELYKTYSEDSNNG